MMNSLYTQTQVSSFTIWSLDSGVPVGDLQDQLGHDSLATTGIYLKASSNHRREAYMRSGLSRLIAGRETLITKNESTASDVYARGMRLSHVNLPPKSFSLDPPILD